MAGKVIERRFELKDRFTPVMQKIQKSQWQYKKDLRDLKKTGTTAFKTLAKGMAVVSGAAAGVYAGLSAITYKTAQYGDHIDKTSQKLGMTRQGFQELDFVLSQNGVSIDQMNTGMKNLSQRMAESVNVGSASQAMFKRLKVSATDSTGAFRSQEEVFMDLISALQDMPEGIEKANMAQKLFGRNGQDLLPMLNTTKGSLEEMREEYRKLGLAMSDEAIDKSVKFSDTLDKLKRTGTAALREIGVVGLSHLTRGMEWILKIVPSIRQHAETTFGRINEVLDQNREKLQAMQHIFFQVRDAMINAFDPAGAGGSAINWLTYTGLPMLIGGMHSVLTSIENTYYFFKDNWSLIAPLVYGIAGAFLLYKSYITMLAAKKAALTIAQWGLNAAMSMSPVGWLVIGIGALIAAGVFLIKNWDDVTLAGKKMWNGIVGFAEWGVNGFIDLVNSLLDTVLGGINAVIRQLNKIPGMDLGTVDAGISKVNFGRAKIDTAGQEFNWGKKSTRPGTGSDQNDFAAAMDEHEKLLSYKADTNQKTTNSLIHALEDNTDTLNSTKGGGNTFNISVYGSDLTAEEIADILVPRIERKLFA